MGYAFPAFCLGFQGSNHDLRYRPLLSRRALAQPSLQFGGYPNREGLSCMG